MSTGYDLFVQWCRDHNRAPPTKAWWDSACALAPDSRKVINTQIEISTGLREVLMDQDEIDRERREGWAYD